MNINLFGWLVDCPAFPIVQHRKQKVPPFDDLNQAAGPSVSIGCRLRQPMHLLLDDCRISTMKEQGRLRAHCGRSCSGAVATWMSHGGSEVRRGFSGASRSALSRF